MRSHSWGFHYSTVVWAVEMKREQGIHFRRSVGQLKYFPVKIEVPMEIRPQRTNVESSVPIQVPPRITTVLETAAVKRSAEANILSVEMQFLLRSDGSVGSCTITRNGMNIK